MTAVTDTASINARKVNLIQRITTIQDEVLLQQLEAMLFPENDWWDELTEQERADLSEGVADLEAGRTESYELFTKRMNSRFQ